MNVKIVMVFIVVGLAHRLEVSAQDLRELCIPLRVGA